MGWDSCFLGGPGWTLALAKGAEQSGGPGGAGGMGRQGLCLCKPEACWWAAWLASLSASTLTLTSSTGEAHRLPGCRQRPPHERPDTAEREVQHAGP